MTGAVAKDTACATTLLRGGGSVRLTLLPSSAGAAGVSVVDGAQLLSSARRRALAASLQPHYTAPQPGPLGKALRAPAKRRFWALVKDKLTLGRGGGSSGSSSGGAGEHLVLWAPSLHDPRFMPFLSAPLRHALLGGSDGAEGAGDMVLYRGMVHPDVPGLAFMGLEAHAGSSLLLLELQAQWLAANLAGRLALPPAAAMRADVAAQRVWRSGALAHPLMSVGGSLARRHEQCYLEQLRQDLRSVSIAAESVATVYAAGQRPALLSAVVSPAGIVSSSSDDGDDAPVSGVGMLSIAPEQSSSAGLQHVAKVVSSASEPLPRLQELQTGAGSPSAKGRRGAGNSRTTGASTQLSATASALDDIKDAHLSVPAATGAGASASGATKASVAAGRSNPLLTIRTGVQHRSEAGGNGEIVGGGTSRRDAGSAGLGASQLLLTSPASPRALPRGASVLHSHSSAKSAMGGVHLYDNRLYGTGRDIDAGAAMASTAEDEDAPQHDAPLVTAAAAAVDGRKSVAEVWASSAAAACAAAAVPSSPAAAAAVAAPTAAGKAAAFLTPAAAAPPASSTSTTAQHRRPPRRSISMPNAQAVLLVAKPHLRHPSPLNPGVGGASTGIARVRTASLLGSPLRQGLGTLSMNFGRSPLGTPRSNVTSFAGGADGGAGAGAAAWRPDCASDAVDALQSQLAALRDHLRNPAQVPFPSAAGASVGAEGAAAPAPVTPSKNASPAVGGFLANMLSFSRASSGHSAAASPRLAPGGPGGGGATPASPSLLTAQPATTASFAASSKPLGAQSSCRLRVAGPDLPVLGEVNEGTEQDALAEATAAVQAAAEAVAKGMHRRLPPRRSQTAYDLGADYTDTALAQLAAFTAGVDAAGSLVSPTSPRLLVEPLREGFRPRATSGGGTAAVSMPTAGSAAAPAAGPSQVAAPASPAPMAQSARGSFIHNLLRRRPPQRTASVGPGESWSTRPALAGSPVPAGTSGVVSVAARTAIAQAMAATATMTSSRRIAALGSESGLPSPAPRGSGAPSAGSRRVRRSATASFLGAGFSTGGVPLLPPVSAAPSPRVTATGGADAASERAAATALLTPCADFVLSPRATLGSAEHRAGQWQAVPAPSPTSVSGNNFASLMSQSAALACGSTSVSRSNANNGLVSGSDAPGAGAALHLTSPRNGAAGVGAAGGTFDLLVSGGGGGGGVTASAAAAILPGMRFSASGSVVHGGGSPVMPGVGSAGPSRMGMGIHGFGSTAGAGAVGGSVAGGTSRKSLVKLGASLANLLSGGGSAGRDAGGGGGGGKSDSGRALGGLLGEAAEAAILPYTKRMAAGSSGGGGGGGGGGGPSGNAVSGASQESSLRADAAYHSSPRSGMAPPPNGTSGGLRAAGKSRTSSSGAFNRSSTGGSSGAQVLPQRPESQQRGGAATGREGAAGGARAYAGACAPAPILGGATSGAHDRPTSAQLAVNDLGPDLVNDDDQDAALLLSLERLTAGQPRTATAPRVPQLAVASASGAGAPEPSGADGTGAEGTPPLPIPLSAVASPPASGASSYPTSVAQSAAATIFASALGSILRPPLVPAAAPGTLTGATNTTAGTTATDMPSPDVALSSARPEEQESPSPFAEGAGPTLDDDDFDASLLLPVDEAAAANFVDLQQSAKLLGSPLSVPLPRPGNVRHTDGAFVAADGAVPTAGTAASSHRQTLGSIKAAEPTQAGPPQRWSFAGSASPAPGSAGRHGGGLPQSQSLVAPDTSPIAQQWAARHTPWLLMARGSRTNQPLDPNHQRHGEPQGPAQRISIAAPTNAGAPCSATPATPATPAAVGHNIDVPLSASAPLPAALGLPQGPGQQQQPAMAIGHGSGVLIGDTAPGHDNNSRNCDGSSTASSTDGEHRLAGGGSGAAGLTRQAHTVAAGGALRGSGSADVAGRDGAAHAAARGAPASTFGFGLTPAADARATKDYRGGNQQRNPPRR